jgi:hypothetical protein
VAVELFAPELFTATCVSARLGNGVEGREKVRNPELFGRIGSFSLAPLEVPAFGREPRPSVALVSALDRGTTASEPRVTGALPAVSEERSERVTLPRPSPDRFGIAKLASLPDAGVAKSLARRIPLRVGTLT